MSLSFYLNVTSLSGTYSYSCCKNCTQLWPGAQRWLREWVCSEMLGIQSRCRMGKTYLSGHVEVHEDDVKSVRPPSLQDGLIGLLAIKGASHLYKSQLQ